MMNGTTLLTWIKGKYIASDDYGNMYYQERFYFNPKPERKPRRWVIYKGIPEASKVPAEWHAWLHFTSDKTPDQANPVGFSWIKPHLPNLTGTKKAYAPSVNKKAKFYKPWQPMA